MLLCSIARRSTILRHLAPVVKAARHNSAILALRLSASRVRDRKGEVAPVGAVGVGEIGGGTSVCAVINGRGSCCGFVDGSEGW